MSLVCAAQGRAQDWRGLTHRGIPSSSLSFPLYRVSFPGPLSQKKQVSLGGLLPRSSLLHSSTIGSCSSGKAMREKRNTCALPFHIFQPPEAPFPAFSDYKNRTAIGGLTGHADGSQPHSWGPPSAQSHVSRRETHRSLLQALSPYHDLPAFT